MSIITYTILEGSDDPTAGMLGLLGAPVPRAMASSRKAARQSFSVRKLGAGRVAMLWEHLLEEKTRRRSNGIPAKSLTRASK